MKITRKFIAEKAGVSPTAVSDVLNSNPKARIGDEVRKRILKVAQQYHYVPNSSARSLVTGKSFNIGLIYKNSMTDYLSDPFSHEVFLGIESEIEQNDYSLVFSLHKQEKALNPSVSRLIYGNFVDGIILSGVVDAEIIHILEQRELPFVLIDYFLKDITTNSVMPDNTTGAYNATNYLIEHGYKSIVCLNGVETGITHPSYVERPAGYFRAIREAGLSETIISTQPDIQGSYQTVTEILNSGKLPEAFFTTGDHMAIGCVRAIKDFNSQLAQEIRVIGFDDICWLESESPAISTVRVPKQDMGKEAVRLLLEKINNPQMAAKCIRLGTELVIRET